MHKISVFNIVSQAVDLLDFSTKYAMLNAGMPFNYVLILWNPSKEVLDWIENKNYEKYSNINIDFYHFFYYTNEGLNFIQNLRNCFNKGFEECFKLTEYACGINTDMMFYSNWLINLYKYRDKNSIINCRQIEPKPTEHHEVMDFGMAGEDFPVEEYLEFCSQIYEDKVITEEEWQGPWADATPHLMHKSVWEKYGPWRVKIVADIDFFRRATGDGIKNMKSLGSIVYHAGAQETKRRRMR